MDLFLVTWFSTGSSFLPLLDFFIQIAPMGSADLSIQKLKRRSADIICFSVDFIIYNKKSFSE